MGVTSWRENAYKWACRVLCPSVCLYVHELYVKASLNSFELKILNLKNVWLAQLNILLNKVQYF